ncbi:uncharacterized serine-rich protein C11G7.01 [Trichoderma asperellum]|uniref:Uncharacterized serine-rich protein C11G7.01 n=1 Tax=Trichoderma asperellum TaxID=101201 RepID=A0A6V8R5X0_TRIAP|nr:uncharacterized serine-rich protein C11G7.01 [Trichoderma asperellum]
MMMIATCFLRCTSTFLPIHASDQPRQRRHHGHNRSTAGFDRTTSGKRSAQFFDSSTGEIDVAARSTANFERTTADIVASIINPDRTPELDSVVYSSSRELDFCAASNILASDYGTAVVDLIELIVTIFDAGLYFFHYIAGPNNQQPPFVNAIPELLQSVISHHNTTTIVNGVTTSSTSTATPNGVAGKDSSSGLSSTAKVAIGVVVPIVAIAILAVIGLFFWKKTRARRQAEAERRKEVEDYAYNPNADPTIPVVGMSGGDSYEMREEESVGYRGWGSTTLAGGSTGRKASTTISGATNNGYSDIAPSRGNMSDAALIDNPEGEILGAMGPAAANNRGDVRRGASNASSSYSATGRSDGSDAGVGVAYGGGGGYYDQYGQSPYETGYGNPGDNMPAPPIIRDNPARRSARVENPGHFPQQSAGISQNF